MEWSQVQGGWCVENIGEQQTEKGPGMRKESRESGYQRKEVDHGLVCGHFFNCLKSFPQFLFFTKLAMTDGLEMGPGGA